MTLSPVNALNVGSDLMHRFQWKWTLGDLEKVQKNGKTVFSCFSCGGGSSMGYKLAGYTVLGNCEIDADMEELYKRNLHPKYAFLMDIRDFNKLQDYPDELKHLDILDGSPPCSVFSMAGDRERGWGKEKVFREGQSKQRLDDLFSHFIRTAEILQPKVVVAENVLGIINKNARGYVNEIIKMFFNSGYTVQMFKLNSAYMGVPQKRERIFFIARRMDLTLAPIQLAFCEPVIKFGEVRSEHGVELQDGVCKELMKYRRPTDKSMNDISIKVRGKVSGYSVSISHDNRVTATNTASGTKLRYIDGKKFSNEDYVNTQTFPHDYDFGKERVQYVTGMSVPPVMMANIATEIYMQWLKDLNTSGN